MSTSSSTVMDPSRIVFTGTSAITLEDLLRTVRSRALAEERHADEVWKASLCSSLLGGEALAWYETEYKAKPSLKQPWKHLRTALVERFGLGEGEGGRQARYYTKMAESEVAC